MTIAMPKKDDRQTEMPLQTQVEMPEAVEPDDIGEDEGETLEWTSHPVKRKPLISVLVSLFILVAGVLMYWSTQSNTFTVLTLVILIASLAKFYFPTHYLLTGKGVYVKTTTQKLFKPWSMYRSFYPDKKGILLSPFGRPTRMENFRGLYVMCAENLQDVKVFVAAHINAPGKSAPTPEDGGKA